jgi:flagellar hook-basal body complex protein FliE
MRDNALLSVISGSTSPELPLAHVPPPTRTPGQADFGATLRQAIDGVEELQLGADEQSRKQALGAGNLHETSIALEKADIAMRVLVKARNKAVEAYHEIMRMSV